ncbi:kinase-like protein [Gigaspora margarita]|uniref:Kinase-like protein n=1 Tax=Gigaspora margarita TaxID=4874 RepID=A0A8H4ETZ2_GIGMA|nr:kinase-like protein [Gigaspora margarita]
MSNWLKNAIKEKYIKSFEFNSFQNSKIIGKGGFGAIYSAYSKNIDKIVALKGLFYGSVNDNTISLNGFSKEVQNITKVTHHDNIIRFFGVTHDPKTETYYMVLQYANDGDLRCYLSNNFAKLNWTTKIRMAKDISKGINCLHNENLVHCDLHDRNILRDKSSDIYSLGVLFWELSSGIPPFNNSSDQQCLAIAIIHGKRESPINETPVDFMNIYCNAWNDDPKLRSNIAEIRHKLECMQMVPVYNNHDNSFLELAEQRFNQLQIGSQDCSNQNFRNYLD